MNRVISSVILIISLVQIFVWADGPELQLINVFFRHGDRTPDINAIYPNDPYKDKKYEPEGFGALTIKGKEKAYKLGQLLRQRYDDFLGSTYFTSNVFAKSTDFDRTKMTLELVLAGLYPPNNLQRWNKCLNWQPIPIAYTPVAEDILYTNIFTCKKYYSNYMKVKEIPEVERKLAPFEDFIKSVEYFTGMNVTDIFQLYVLDGHLQAQMEMGLNLPNWTRGIFPNGQLLNSSLAVLEILNYNDDLKKLMGGKLLRITSENMLSVVNGSNKEINRKIYLYSLHDINIAGLLAALNLRNTEVPKYCSAIIIELLLDNGKYFVKIVHYLSESPKFEEIQIPRCGKLCPLEDFLSLIKNVIPSDDDLKCD